MSKLCLWVKGNSYATLCHTHSLFDAVRNHPVETTSQLRGFRVRGDPWDTGRGLKERTWTIHSLAWINVLLSKSYRH